MKVFLGGTTSDSKWREKLIPLLKIDHFNPVVKKWTKEAKIEEEKQKEISDYRLYVITRTYSMYSIAEVVDDSNKFPEKAILCVINEQLSNGKMAFTKSNLNRLEAVGNIVKSNGGKYFTSIEDVANHLNQSA
ncbi:hypothetical protein CVD28_03400 [Bacillus sp. M6-12]|uniref:nucleoside 2-deoxyribosyltransferase domain-containing protein n=1 Tax=Bacillus sp. M6-12 TaxID=2054166 RepID=UPI000C778F6D|nr:nucleoside 2-deoxyribosyltransferase domain-containing protein [Bacillus sp. M6-12]PLS19475.1 hypothetical protein CVD28_03400 [Bacillus sp. M6-12]